MDCKHFFDDDGNCRRCSERKPGSLNGRWPTGTWMQRRLAATLRQTADEIEREVDYDRTAPTQNS